MTPIHEQEWRVDESGDVSLGDEVVAIIEPTGDHDRRALGTFVSAAPDMARALLALTASGHTPDSLSAAISAGMTALRKAGILP